MATQITAQQGLDSGMPTAGSSRKSSQDSIAIPPPLASPYRLNSERVEIPLHALVSRTTSEAPQEIHTTKGRRWAILGLCIVAMFIDVLSSSAFFVFTSVIAADIGIVFEQQTWIINAYVVTFASFLLFWGRVSDIYSPRPVFAYGFIAFGLLSLINSFLIDRFSFFIVRAITGIAGAALVPSAYRLIASVFPPEERGLAYTLYGMTGSVANVTGTLIAGVFELIPATGQMSGWRWFFRTFGMVCVGSGVVSIWLIPRMAKSDVPDKIKRLDLVGVVTLLLAIVCLILSLTLGASYGFRTAAFLVPLILSVLLFPAFFYWETRLSEHTALIPPSLWRLKNFSVLITLGLVVLGSWGVVFMPLIELYHNVHGEKMISAAVRVLPIGIAAGVISVVLVVFPQIIAKPRWPIAGALLMAMAAFALWSQADVVDDYWRLMFPAMIIGSTGLQILLLATIVAVMLVAPPEQAGVVGAVLQTSMQASTVIALSIQAGLLTIQPGGLENISNVRASWYFQLGWLGVWLVGFLSLYRP